MRMKRRFRFLGSIPLAIVSLLRKTKRHLLQAKIEFFASFTKWNSGYRAHNAVWFLEDPIPQRTKLELVKYRFNQFEIDSLELVSKYLRKEATAIDVGANVGIWYSFLVQQTLARGRCIAFEPNPSCAAILRAIKFDAGAGMVREVALGATRGSGILWLNSDDKTSVFSSFSELTETSGLKVCVSTLDEEVRSMSIEDVGFLKIDVEGFEIEVLTGAAKVIELFRPDIVLEFNLKSLAFRESSAKPLEKLIRSYGYSIFREGSGSRLVEVGSLWDISSVVNNLHCFHETRLPEIKKLVRST